MESPRKKMVVGDEGGEGGDGSESSESVVLQCTESGAVEQGEEVAMARRGESAPRREVPYTDRYGSLTVAFQTYCDGAKVGGKGEDMAMIENAHACVESTEDGVSESKEFVGVRFVDRSLGGRKIIVTPRMASFQNESGYWRTGARRRCRARKSFMHGPFGVGASFVVGRTAIKRKHEEVKQCSAVILEAEHHEDNDSGDSVSSSDSDASDSESEQWKRRDASRKRRGGEDVSGKSPWSDESLEMRSGGRKKPSLMTQESVAMREDEQEAVDYDDELKEMQQLLELQLHAAEKREAGMKQRMEMMMDVLSQHMGHMEKRVSNLQEGTQPREQVLERINVKLEKVMEGFSALNENLAILSACLSKNLESQ